MNRISVSQIQTLMTCPKAWWFSYVRGIKAPGSEAMRLGSAFHALVFEGKEPPEDLAETLKPMKAAYDAHTKHLPPVKFTEVEIRVTNDDFDYLGFVDAVRVADSGTWYISELKTRSTLDGFDPTTIDFDLQLCAYASFVHEIGTKCGLPERNFGGIYFERVTKPRRGKPLEVDILFRPFDEVQSHIARNALCWASKTIDVINQIGNAPRNHAACTRFGERCFYYEMCHEKH